MNYYIEQEIIYYLLFFAGIIITIFAEIKIQSAYSKYKEINNSKEMTGEEVAHRILNKNGLEHISIHSVNGNLSDHYNPSTEVINLSDDVFNNYSIASIAVAAHECGHAIQKKEGYGFFKLRHTLIPVVNLINYAGYIVLLISIFGSFIQYIEVSIVMILASLVFQLITLPVEFDASRRGKQQLVELGFISEEDREGVEKVLSAAAFTYVAGVLSSLLNLLRLLLIFNNRRRR